MHINVREACCSHLCASLLYNRFSKGNALLQGTASPALLECLRQTFTEELQAMLCDVDNGKIDASAHLPVSS